MQHTEEQWQILNAKLSRLQAENLQLRKELQESTNWNGQAQYDLMRSSVQPPRSKTQNCPHCFRPEKSRKQLVEEFQGWSHRLNNNFIMKNHLPNIGEQNDGHNAKEDFQIELADSPRDINLFQKICLFGPCEDDVIAGENTKTAVAHQLYFPERDQNLQVYGNYLYPERVPAKLIREKNKLIEIDRIIFRKSLKNTDCQVFIFQCQQEYQGNTKIQNPLCKDVNPFRSLFNISLEFNDYIFSDEPYRGKVQRSLSMIDDRGEEMQGVEGQEEANETIKKDKEKDSHIVYGSNSVYKSSFRLCVMTYFPFINFFCELLIHLVDKIKIRRIEEHSKQQKKYHILDIKYVTRELQEILKELTPTLNSFSVKQGASLSLKFGQETMNLQLDKSQLKRQLAGGWAFKMLQLMDKQTLYDIYCLMMLEESICFICEKSHVLTFFIYLFVELLVKPFSYPHPIVSIVFQDDLLQTPFTAILGINKDNKWLETNDSFLSEKMEGKIIVNLNGDQIKIRSKKKVKIPKSQKLKKIFSNFYKRADKLMSSFKKKEVQMKQTTIAENQVTLQLLNQIEGFYEDQITPFMPNREIIDSIRSSISTDNQTMVNTKLIKDIQQYIKESRKHAEQQLFISSFMQKQIFYVYLTSTYDIV